jgi:hypothetical protein
MCSEVHETGNVFVQEEKPEFLVDRNFGSITAVVGTISFHEKTL